MTNNALAQQIAARLESIALDKQTVYYSDLVREFRLPPLDVPWGTHPLAGIFDVLDQEDAAKDRPFRTSVVVSKAKNQPGRGFYSSLERFKGIRDPQSSEGRASLWKSEVTAAHDYSWT